MYYTAWYSGFVAASKQSDIRHGSVLIEPDHQRLTCSEEIAFRPAEITDSLSGAYELVKVAG